MVKTKSETSTALKGLALNEINDQKMSQFRNSVYNFVIRQFCYERIFYFEIKTLYGHYIVVIYFLLVLEVNLGITGRPNSEYKDNDTNLHDGLFSITVNGFR